MMQIKAVRERDGQLEHRTFSAEEWGMMPAHRYGWDEELTPVTEIPDEVREAMNRPQTGGIIVTRRPVRDAELEQFLKQNDTENEETN